MAIPQLRFKKDEHRAVAFGAVFPVWIIWMELCVILYCYHGLLLKGCLYTVLFSIVTGLFVGLVSSFGNRRVNFTISAVIMLFFTVVVSIQAVYYTIFKTFTTVYSVMNAGAVLSNFWREALIGIWNTLPVLIILFLPLILYLIFGRELPPERIIPFRAIALTAAVIVALFSVCTTLVRDDREGLMSYKYVYDDVFSPLLSVQRFGVLTTLRLDIQDTYFEKEENSAPKMDLQSDIEGKLLTQWLDLSVIGLEESEGEKEYGKNILDIDFNALAEAETNPTIADMHRYFGSLPGSSKNEYTGMFEGYNLIWIVGESFSRYTLSEEYTPTLYKMSNEGFVFENFYNPVWYVSTSDGEYTTTTGLIPKSGVWSFSRSAKNYMPFGFGNMFRELGYDCYAFHGHTYTYYDRDSSHPNMGYDYYALGNGLDMTKVWPESDVELMEKSLPYYINSDHFHVYYMTVSGHMNYNFMGNVMAAKHRDDVQPMLDAGYSEAASAYVACNMEFDQSIEYLIDELDKAGVLDNTLIVISGDHYPYGLTMDEIEELNGGDVEENFELYRTTLIVWNSKMKTEHVSKYCCSLDIMPTLANLFGLDYDSRLTMGSDIFSDAPELVIFNNRSFICEKGRYDSGRDKFIWNEGCEEDNEYAVNMIQQVNDKFAYSSKILDNDYYRKVLGREEQ